MSVFASSKIVPDVVDQAPSQVVKIDFPSGVSVNLGNALTPTQVKDQPTLTLPQSDKLYTIVFTDPDNKNAENDDEWHHWLAINVPLTNGQADISKGEVLAAYIGSGPPKGTGVHRYVYMVFEQKGKISDKEHGHLGRSVDGRANFNTRKFMAKHGFEKPFAGNFYNAEFDDYVPLLYKSLGAA